MDDSIERYARAARRVVVLCTGATVVAAGFGVVTGHHGVTAGVFAVLSLYAGICWLRWFRPAYRIVADAGRARFRDWVTFWGWVIPGLTAFAPLWLAEDVWRAPDPPGREEPLPRAIRTWWVLWCIADLLQLLNTRSRGASFDPVGWISWALLLVSTPWAVATVRLLTERVVLLERLMREAEREARRQAAV